MSIFAKILPFLDDFGFVEVGGLTLAPDYDPVWLRCQEAVLSALVAMADAGDLAGISSANIVAAEQPDVSRLFGSTGKCLTLSYPGAIVWPFQQESTNIADGDNLRDEITYPVAISLVDKGSSATGEDGMIVNRATRRRHLLWREKISRKFRHFLATPAEIRDVYVRYQLFAIPSAYKNDDLYHGAIVVDFISQETRDNFGG